MQNCTVTQTTLDNLSQENGWISRLICEASRPYGLTYAILPYQNAFSQPNGTATKRGERLTKAKGIRLYTHTGRTDFSPSLWADWQPKNI